MTEPRENQGHRLISNAFWNGFPSLFRMALGFFLVPFILSMVDADLYGVWRLSFAVLAASWILQLGLNSAVSREVSQGLVRKDFQRINEVISTTFSFYFILSSIVLLTTFVMVEYFPYWFKVNEENYSVSREVIGLTGLGFVVWMPFAIFRAALHGLQAFRFLGTVELIGSIAYAAAVVIMLNRGFGVVALTAASVARMVVPVVLFMVIAKRLCPQIELSFRSTKFSIFRSIFAYSFNSAIFTVASAFFAQGSLWVTGTLLGTEQTAYFSICNQMAALIGGTLSISLVVAKPAASQFQAQGDMERVRVLFLRSTKYTIMIAMPAAIFLSVFRDDILMLWLRRRDFLDYSFLVPILAFMQVGWLCLQANYYVINGIGRHRIFAFMAVATTALALLLAVLLVKQSRWGLGGVAVGMSIPVIFASLILMPVYSCKVLGIRLKNYFHQCWGRTLMPLIIFIFILVGWKHISEPLSLVQLLLCMIISATLLSAGYWLGSLAKNEKETFLSLLSRMFGGFRKRKRIAG